MTEKLRQDYTIDLRKIEGNGDFPCPGCGTIISPGDDTETRYVIVETNLKDNNLEKLVLDCQKCRGRTELIGFAPSEELPSKPKEYSR